jgi:hypothetical protein
VLHRHLLAQILRLLRPRGGAHGGVFEEEAEGGERGGGGAGGGGEFTARGVARSLEAVGALKLDHTGAAGVY